jgi:hypothetical protein
MPFHYPMRVQAYLCPTCGPSLAPADGYGELVCLFCPTPEEELADASYEEDEDEDEYL